MPLRFYCTLVFVVGLTLYSKAQLQITELTQKQHITALVQKHLLGDGIKLIKVEFQGNNQAVGSFTNTQRQTGFSKGIALSTGRVVQLAGTNNRPNAGANFGNYFFFDEDLITKASQCDGAVLTIDFIPLADSLSLAFVFGSEEYPEFVNKEFNDMFQMQLQPLFIKAKSKNLAMLPNKKMVSVNNINANQNSELYIDNTIPNSPLYYITQLDGLTQPIYTGAKVAAGKPYRLKIMLVDLEDCEYDSGILLEAYSLRSLSTKPKIYTPQTQTYRFNFATNKSTLPQQDLALVKRLADSIGRFSFDSIVVFGHTDDVGNTDSNTVLSYNRAVYLTNQLALSGVKCAKFVAIGKGSSMPLANQTNKALNRRVEIVFYRKSK